MKEGLYTNGVQEVQQRMALGSRGKYRPSRTQELRRS